LIAQFLNQLPNYPITQLLDFTMLEC
jgi:hypothetical protein